VISVSEEVPIQARNCKWLRHRGFLTMGEGTHENASELQVQINSLPVIHDAIMILVRVQACK